MARHDETTSIGDAGPLVTRLGLGASVIGGLFNPVTALEARAVVRQALDVGIRYVDTAPLYGLGASERRIGEVVAGRPRGSFTVSTKVGRLIRARSALSEELPDGMWHVPDDVLPMLDFSREGVRRSLAESLDRLGLSHVDMAFVHDPDDHLDQAISEALPALAELRAEGVVHAIGVGTGSVHVLTRIVREIRPDCILVAGRYTLLDQSALAVLLPDCESRGVAVIVGGVLNSGVLADPSPGARFEYEEASPDVLRRARMVADVCAAHGAPLAAAALQFPLGHPAVVSVLAGVRSVAELEANVRSFDSQLPAALWDDLVASGAVAETAPFPPLVAA